MRLHHPKDLTVLLLGILTLLLLMLWFGTMGSRNLMYEDNTGVQRLSDHVLTGTAYRS